MKHVWLGLLAILLAACGDQTPPTAANQPIGQQPTPTGQATLATQRIGQFGISGFTTLPPNPAVIHLEIDVHNLDATENAAAAAVGNDPASLASLWTILLPQINAAKALGFDPTAVQPELPFLGTEYQSRVLGQADPTNTAALVNTYYIEISETTTGYLASQIAAGAVPGGALQLQLSYTPGGSTPITAPSLVTINVPVGT